MSSRLLAWTNRIVSICLFLTGLFVLIYSLAYLDFGSFSSPKGGFVPIVFSIGLMIFSFVEIVRAMVSNAEIPSKFKGLDWKKLGLYYLECIAYVFLIDKIGFLIDTILVLFIMLKQCGTKGIIKPLIITLITSFLLWGVFRYAMGILLPEAAWF